MQTMWVDQAAALKKFKTQAEKIRLDDIIGDAGRAMKTQSPFMSDEARARGNLTIDLAKARSQTAFSGRTTLDTAEAGRQAQLIKFQESVMNQIKAQRIARGNVAATPKERTNIRDFQSQLQAMLQNSRFGAGSQNEQRFFAQFANLQSLAHRTVGGVQGEEQKSNLFGNQRFLLIRAFLLC